MSRVAPKRVRVFEDAENVGCKKIKSKSGTNKGKPGTNNSKADLGEKPERGFRKPLADLKHRNSSVVVNKNDKTVRCRDGQSNEADSETKARELINKALHGVEISKPHGPQVSRNSLQSREKIRDQNQTVFSVPYYLNEIYTYLYSLEERFEVPKDHLEGQGFTGPMRAVLIDWLSGLVDHMDLLQETLQLTVYVIDKYMSINRTTTKDTAQLIGLSALFIAAKYEETEVIELTDLTIICGHAWLEKDIKTKEREILGAIGYQLGRPLAIHFIRRLTKVSGASPMEHCYAKFFADTSLLSYQLSHVKPSTIAAASTFLGLCVSRNRIDDAFWTTTLAECSGYELDDLRPVLKLMARAVIGADAGKLHGIKSRYSCSQLYCVSIMPGCKAGGIINSF